MKKVTCFIFTLIIASNCWAASLEKDLDEIDRKIRKYEAKENNCKSEAAEKAKFHGALSVMLRACHDKYKYDLEKLNIQRDKIHKSILMRDGAIRSKEWSAKNHDLIDAANNVCHNYPFFKFKGDIKYTLHDELDEFEYGIIYNYEIRNKDISELCNILGGLTMESPGLAIVVKKILIQSKGELK